MKKKSIIILTKKGAKQRTGKGRFLLEKMARLGEN